MKKILTGKYHLVWDKDGNIIVDYYQKDGKAKTYYDDNTKERLEGFSHALKSEIDRKKIDKKLKEKIDVDMVLEVSNVKK